MNLQVPAVEEIKPAGDGAPAALRTKTGGLYAGRHDDEIQDTLNTKHDTL